MCKALISYITAWEPQSSLFVYKYNDKRKLGKREISYDKAIGQCQELFPEIPACSSFSFHTKDLDICEGEMLEISEVSWSDAVVLLKSVTVMVTPSSRSSSPGKEMGAPTRPDAHLINFITPNGSIIAINTYVNTSFRRIKKIVSRRMDSQDPRDFLFTYKGDILNDNETPRSINMDSDSFIGIMPALLGKKPVIYLLSPTPLEASVKLSLAPQWDLSVIYPVVPIKARLNSNSNQEVTWRVKVLPNGDLKELTTGLDVTFLFWEALTNPNRPPSPPATPTVEKSEQNITEIFDPSNAILSDNNSAVMAVDKITPYLDKALLGLGLHTEARTSFITYWLPAFLKHQNIALRFVPQAAYHRAAPLDVSPAPDVITRIFMIFRGVKDDELDEWTRARESVDKDVSFWQDVVGVDVQKALNTNLFRVLEWGGMEVVRGL